MKPSNKTSFLDLPVPSLCDALHFHNNQKIFKAEHPKHVRLLYMFSLHLVMLDISEIYLIIQNIYVVLINPFTQE